jgi:hypothetical protein
MYKDVCTSIYFGRLDPRNPRGNPVVANCGRHPLSFPCGLFLWIRTQTPDRRSNVPHMCHAVPVMAFTASENRGLLLSGSVGNRARHIRRCIGPP